LKIEDGGLLSSILHHPSSILKMNSRLDHLRRLAAERDADAVLLAFAPHVRWAVGFTGSSGVLVVTAGAAHFVTDGRYGSQAAAEVEGAEVHVPGYRLFEHVAEANLLGEAETVLVQGDRLTYDEVERLRTLLQERRIHPEGGWLDPVVAAKTEDEVERVRAAQAVTDAVFSEILPFVGPGVSERDLAAEIVYQHLKRGCERMAFEPIVASGPRSALPHAHATTRTFRPGEVVLLDMGGVLDGYASDMTRVVAIGEPEPAVRLVYDTVLRAQEAALEAAAAGRTGKELDTAARAVIEAAGYGDAFLHGLGHGVGLQTHEWPRLSQRAEDVLPAGATVTVEPGIYLPDRFGVRIEDLVVIREGGYENLTASPKALLVL
jgi:Xaa-Pro aminopeptidase